MANIVAMNSMYGRLGFTQAASTLLSGAQGMDDVTELGLLTDIEVDALCKLVRSPGGMIANPLGRGPQIVAPGCGVSMRAITNLKLACYFIRHQARTSRDCDPASVTLARVRELRPLRVSELAYAVPTDPIIINDKNWPKTLESLSLWIARHQGVSKAPLGYIIRNSDVSPVDPDPRMGVVGSQYVSHHEEMLARCPHFQNRIAVPYSEDYTADNTAVWDLISGTFKTHPAWTVVRPFQRSKDGRNAYLALYQHYLGASSVDNMSSSAEKNLKLANYKGESRKWNFEKYVRVHMDQHQILNDLKEHGYAGIDERSRSATSRMASRIPPSIL